MHDNGRMSSEQNRAFSDRQFCFHFFGWMFFLRTFRSWIGRFLEDLRKDHSRTRGGALWADFYTPFYASVQRVLLSIFLLMVLVFLFRAIE